MFFYYKKQQRDGHKNIKASWVGIGKLCPGKSILANLGTTHKSYDFPGVASRLCEFNQGTGSSYN